MLKKSLLSLAVAASLGVSGCNISSTSGNADADSVQPDVTPEELAAQRGVFPIFDPANSKLPLGLDLIMAKASSTDGSADTNKAGKPDENPVTNAIDRLDGGIGVLNPIDIPMSGSITTDPTVLATSVYLIQLTNKDTNNDPDQNNDADSPLTDALNILDIVGIEGPDANADGQPDDARIAPVAEIMNGAASIPTATQTPGAAKIKVEAISVNGGTNNVLRISPLEPLKPRTKYIVAVLKQLQDASGNQINSDINYEKITGTEQLSVSSFEAVRGALNAWEQVAAGAITNVVQSQNPAASVSADDLAITGAFTTVSTDTVLTGMATAAIGASQFLQGAIASSVKSQVRADTTLDQTDYAARWDDINEKYTGIATAGVVSDAQGELISSILNQTDYESSLPVPRTTNFLTTLATDNSLANLPNGGTIIQGQIKLPYYMGIPEQASGTSASTAAIAAVQGTLMSADTGIDDFIETQLAKASVRSAALAQEPAVVIAHGDVTEEQIAGAKTQLPTIPPADADGNTYVNGRYPFPQKTGDVYSPVMIHLPDTGADSGTAQAPNIECGSAAAAGAGALCPVVIYVHGIGGNRSHSLALANGGLSAAGYATVAIDLPLHGVAPILQGAADSALAFSVDTASGSQVAAAVDADETYANLIERHFGYGTSATGVLTPLVYDDPTTESTNEALAATQYPTLMSNSSAAAFINLSTFAVTRDLMRQAVMDLLNLSASLATMDFDGHEGPDFDTSNVHVVGHSLGSIIASTFVNTLNSAKGAYAQVAGHPDYLPAVSSLSLVTPGGGLARLLENSPSFAGSPTASPLASDGMNPNPEFGLLAKLGANNITQGTSTLESFLSVFQATVDSVDPMAIATADGLDAANILAIEVVGDGTDANKPDQTIPNAASGDDGTATAPLGLANKAYLSGTDPLVGAKGLNLTTNSALAGGGNRQLLRVTKGGHSSILSATSADELLSQAFQIEAVTSFIVTGGAAISVTQSTTNAADILEQ